MAVEVGRGAEVSQVEVKERPILMHARSIVGILEGRKTQTRRIVTARNSTVLGYPARVKRDAREWFDGWKGLDFSKAWKDGKASEAAYFGNGEYLHVPLVEDSRAYRIRSRVEPGDRLWVRENWRAGVALYDRKKVFMCVYLDAEGKVTEFDRMAPDVPVESRNNALLWKTKPSIHMPRWASRLTLGVTGIRVERVQDISPRDCIAEGIDDSRHKCGCEHCSMTDAICPATASSLIMEFASLWEDTNGKGAWDRNDWVWVVEFRRVT